MSVSPYDVSPYNTHYDGAYNETELRWRRLSAIDKVNNLEAALSGRTVDKVLEVGCGTGAVLAEIERRKIGNHHMGVDLSNPDLHVDEGAAHLQLMQFDGERLPFDDNSFDLVIASHVVEHVPNPRQFLGELSRVSKHLMYIEVPCDITVRMSRSAIQRGLGIGHINGYTPEFFMILLQTCELDICNFEIFDHSEEVSFFDGKNLKSILQRRLRQLARKISPIFATRLFCYHCGALVAKR